MYLRPTSNAFKVLVMIFMTHLASWSYAQAQTVEGFLLGRSPERLVSPFEKYDPSSGLTPEEQARRDFEAEQSKGPSDQERYARTLGRLRQEAAEKEQEQVRQRLMQDRLDRAAAQRARRVCVDTPQPGYDYRDLMLSGAGKPAYCNLPSF